MMLIKCELCAKNRTQPVALPPLNIRPKTPNKMQKQQFTKKINKIEYANILPERKYLRPVYLAYMAGLTIAETPSEAKNRVE